MAQAVLEVPVDLEAQVKIHAIQTVQEVTQMVLEVLEVPAAQVEIYAIQTVQEETHMVQVVLEDPEAQVEIHAIQTVQEVNQRVQAVLGVLVGPEAPVVPTHQGALMVQEDLGDPEVPVDPEVLVDQAA